MVEANESRAAALKRYLAAQRPRYAHTFAAALRSNNNNNNNNNRTQHRHHNTPSTPSNNNDNNTHHASPQQSTPTPSDASSSSTSSSARRRQKKRSLNYSLLSLGGYTRLLPTHAFKKLPRRRFASHERRSGEQRSPGLCTPPIASRARLPAECRV